MLFGALLFACWAVWEILKAIGAVLATPYPWIVLAAGAIGYGAFHAVRIYRQQRREKLFFDAIAAVDARAPDAEVLVADLVSKAGFEADAMLLASAYYASAERPQDALATLGRAMELRESVGRLSGGIDLWFAGMPQSIWFGQDPALSASLQLVQAYLFLRDGRPSETIARLSEQPQGSYDLLIATTLAEAHAQTGNPTRSAALLQRAVQCQGADEPVLAQLRHRLAATFESLGMFDRASAEYQRLARSGDGEAAARLEALERGRAEEERRAAEERQRDALARAVARADEHLSLGEPSAAVSFLRKALVIPTDAATRNALRRRLAETYEAAEMENQAAALYEELAAEGDDDARRRLNLLRKAQAERAQQRAAEQEQDAFATALAKLRAAKGPARRRAVLHIGLDAIRRPELRDRLMVEASRIEVLAVLDKVDELKTTHAKRRHLTAALEVLRTDDVPDELQEQQIRWLEDALTELDA